MVIGQYEITGKIGEGGMGVIYRGVHSLLQNTVAIKALPSSLSSNPEIRERFVREATIQAKISHPNIVNIHDFFEYEGNYYIVMEYVEGETLEAIIKRLGLIPPDRCMSLFEQIAAGIGYAHEMGIVHRDLKPANIMVNSQGVVKIMDFGIAKMNGDLNLTRAGTKVGTVWYMSPEQVKGAPASVRTDIYSLGVTLFEMVTGRVPFYADSEYNVMKTIVESAPSSPKTFYPYIPEQMEAAILKAMAKNPVERFRSVKEFARALNQPHSPDISRATSATEAKPAVKLGRFRLPPKQGLLLGALLLIALFALLLFASIGGVPSTMQVARSSAEGNAPAVNPEPAPRQTVVPTPPEPDAGSAPVVIVPPASTKPDSAAATEEKGAQDAREPGRLETPRAETRSEKMKQKVQRYITLGQKYHEDGKFPEAREMFRKVLKLDRENQDARTGINNANQAERALLLR